MPDSLDNALNELSDLPSGATESTLMVKEAENFPITAGKLRALCAKNPDHPLAKLKVKSVEGFPDNTNVVVERPDLLAIVDNKDINFVTKVETRKIAGGEKKVTVVRKQLVERGKATNPEPPSGNFSGMDIVPTEPVEE